jgi:hypothetical protein
MVCEMRYKAKSATLVLSTVRSTMKSGRQKVNCLYAGDLDHRL